MGTIMHRPSPAKHGSLPGKFGNLGLVSDVPSSASRALTPEQWLDRGFREICTSCKSRKPSGTLGGYACRAVADVAQELRFPMRVIAKIITAVIVGFGPDDFEDRVGHLLIEFGKRKRHALGRSTPPHDDHRAAAMRKMA